MGRARPSATAHLSFLTLSHGNCPGPRVLAHSHRHRARKARRVHSEEERSRDRAGRSRRAGRAGSKAAFRARPPRTFPVAFGTSRSGGGRWTFLKQEREVSGAERGRGAGAWRGRVGAGLGARRRRDARPAGLSVF